MALFGIADWFRKRRELKAARQTLERQLRQVDQEEEHARGQVQQHRKVLQKAFASKGSVRLVVPHEPLDLPGAYFDALRAGHQLKYRLLEAKLTRAPSSELQRLTGQLAKVQLLHGHVEKLREIDRRVESLRNTLQNSQAEHHVQWNQGVREYNRLHEWNRNVLDEVGVRNKGQLRDVMVAVGRAEGLGSTRYQKYARALKLIEERETRAGALERRLEPIAREWRAHNANLAREMERFHRQKAEFHRQAMGLYTERILPRLRAAA